MEADREGSMGVPRTMKASEFKAKCLKLMDEVAATGEEILITKNGRPVSKLVPCDERAETLFGRDRHVIRIHGDIVGPMPREWWDDADDEEQDLF